MRNGYRTIKSFLFGVAVMAALLYGVTVAFADVEPTVRSNSDEAYGIAPAAGTYYSETIKTTYPFNAAGFAWQGDSSYVSFEFRLYDDDGWGEWHQNENDSYIEYNDWHYSYEPLLADRATQIQYRFTTEGAVSAVKLIYIDAEATMIKPSFKLFDWLFGEALAASSYSIVPRSGWNADEDWRYNSNGQEKWTREIIAPEKFIIHHTAGDPGTNNPQATIRAIYYWHAVVLGWGDIGYNYIIDQNGTIYEGRAGGDGVVAGHTYRSAACAASRFGGSHNEAGFNRGTVGVAVLGDYETGLTLNSAVKASLENLIGHKAALFGIDPSASSYFVDNTYPNVIGHQDVDCSSCPGVNLQSELSSIRSGAKSVFLAAGGKAGTTQFAYAGEVIDQDILPATYTGALQTVTTTVLNTGTNTWSRGQVKLNIYDLGDARSRFHDHSWPTQLGGFDFAEHEVKPGGTATFTSRLRSPDRMGRYLNIYRLSGPSDLVQQDDRSITRVDSRYQAELISQNIPPALLYVWRPTVTVQFRNIGIATWDRHVTLDTFDLGGATSRFVHDSWVSRNTPAVLRESSVPRGGIGTFTFRLNPPTPGMYLNTFYIQRWGENIQNGTFSLITRVD